MTGCGEEDEQFILDRCVTLWFLFKQKSAPEYPSSPCKAPAGS